jgi:hypothetical protein
LELDNNPDSLQFHQKLNQKEILYEENLSS